MTKKYPLLKKIKASVTAHEKPDPSAMTQVVGGVTVGHGSVAEHLHLLKEGGLVIDGSQMPMDRARRATQNGPMLSMEIGPEEYEKCPQPSSMMLDGLQGQFGMLARAVATDPGYRGMDRAGILIYARYWQEAGARIGTRVGDVIVWEDQTEEEIR